MEQAAQDIPSGFELQPDQGQSCNDKEGIKQHSVGCAVVIAEVAVIIPYQAQCHTKQTILVIVIDIAQIRQSASDPEGGSQFEDGQQTALPLRMRNTGQIGSQRIQEVGE